MTESQHKEIMDTLKGISTRQDKHEGEDVKRFDEIPKKEDIEKAVAESVKITVNGKIDAIKTHLEKQDAMLISLDAKIKPFSQTKWFLTTAGKGLMYAGGLAGAILGLLYFFREIK